MKTITTFTARGLPKHWLDALNNQEKKRFPERNRKQLLKNEKREQTAVSGSHWST
jgi:hypothetical protein